jgi:hypothetical protein
LLDQAIAATVQSVFWFSLIGFSLLAGVGAWLLMRMRPARQLTVAPSYDRAPETREAPLGVIQPFAYDVPPTRIMTAEEIYDEAYSEAEKPAPFITNEATLSLTFADIESKAKLNVREILDRSAAIRARLNLDFVDDFTTDSATPPAISSAASTEPKSQPESEPKSEPALSLLTPPPPAKRTAKKSGQSFVRKPQMKEPNV